MNYKEKTIEASQYINSKIQIKPKVGMILGSGLGDLAEEIEDAIYLDYGEIPHFPTSSVIGHKGRLVIGQLNGQQVMAMQGRIHYYEGYTMKDITFPVRVMGLMGIDTMIVTNACGGINPEFYAGALMIINDHINLMGDNPLIGENYEDFGPRFPDMLNAYNKDLITLANKVAKENDITVFNGIHSAVSGPNFETGAELRMLATLGADTVGMSTIPEVMVAHHMGIKSLGISAITDMAIGDQPEEITHEDVIKVASEIKPKFIKLVRNILSKLG